MTNDHPYENRIMRIIASIIVGVFGSIVGLVLALLIFGGISYAYLLATDLSFESAGTMVIMVGMFCLVPFGLIAMLSAGTFAGKMAYGTLSNLADSQPDAPVQVDDNADLPAERPSKAPPPPPITPQPIKQENQKKKRTSIIVGILSSLLIAVPVMAAVALTIILTYSTIIHGKLFGGAGEIIVAVTMLCLPLLGIAAAIAAGVFAERTAYRVLANKADERAADLAPKTRQVLAQPNKGDRRAKIISLIIIAIGGACLTLFVLARITPFMPITEREALEALGYDPNWQSPCHLNGVLCDDSGHVKTLDIEHPLTAIPSEIGQLSQLKRLTIANNQLRVVAPEIGQLSHLESLSLPFNELKTIPPEIGNLVSLQKLRLDSNQLIGAVPPELGNLSNLQFLQLSYNELATLPSEIGNLVSLEEALLNNNQFSDIPLEMGNLAVLEKLSFSDNQLSRIPSELRGLVSLEKLYLNDNQISGAIPPELGMLPNLHVLSLHNNQLNGRIPPELSSLSALYSLNLSNNQFEGSIPPELGKLSALTSLDLSDNQLDGSIPPELGQLSNLDKLYLQNNQLGGTIPTQVLYMHWLLHSDFSGNQLDN